MTHYLYDNNLLKAMYSLCLASVIRLVTAAPAFSAIFSCPNGHFYDFVSTYCNQPWTEAKNQAAAAGGYLVTVTSAAEQTCLEGNVPVGPVDINLVSWWTGGSDAAAEGQWLWETGPETGVQFWSGGPGGSTTGPDNYANWFGGEPSGGGENYMVWNRGPFGWNDVPVSNGLVCGYIVEFDTAPASFDVASNFSSTNNPNGPWSYGYSTTLGGAFMPYTVQGPFSGAVPAIRGWFGLEFGSGEPWALKNFSSGNLKISGIDLDGGKLALHPGPGPIKEFSIARWTAPSDDTYDVDAVFESRDRFVGATTDVHVFRNGVSEFDSVINCFRLGCPQSYSGTLPLIAGDTIDFVVGNGDQPLGSGASWYVREGITTGG